MDFTSQWLYIITVQLCMWPYCRTGYIPCHCGSFTQLPNISWDVFGYYCLAAFPAFWKKSEKHLEFHGTSSEELTHEHSYFIGKCLPRQSLSFLFFAAK